MENMEINEQRHTEKTSPSLIVLFALLYFLIAKVGLTLPVLGGNVSLVWPASGLGMAFTFVLGRRAAVGIFLGAGLATATTAVPLTVVFGAALANTAVALTGASLLRWFGVHSLLHTLTETSLFIIVAVLFAPIVSATIGVTALHMADIRASEGALWVGFRWWLGDAFGVLLVAPAILTALDVTILGLSQKRRSEFLLVTLLQCCVLALAFSTALKESLYLPLLGYFVFPFLIWSSLRYTIREATFLSFLMAVIAVVGTARGDGPFAPLGAINIVALSLYSITLATMTLFLATLRHQCADYWRSVRGAGRGATLM